MNRNRHIEIRGLRMHNLRGIDLDIPLGKLVVISGVSGSGKSTLAFDTLFAEGQRRYIETFSAYARQFLERIDRPDADSIQNIPAAIAIRQHTAVRNSRSTVGSVTEINDFLRLLFAKIGRVYCLACGQLVQSDTAQTVMAHAAALPAGTEFLVTFPMQVPRRSASPDAVTSLRADGFVRVFAGGSILELDLPLPPNLPAGEPFFVVVDRLTAGRTPVDRLLDSIETAIAKGQGRCAVIEMRSPGTPTAGRPTQRRRKHQAGDHTIALFNCQWRCEPCDRDYPAPQPRLYNSNNPLGACPDCRGFGDVIDIDMDRVVPDRSKSLREEAIAPWRVPAYRHELDELIALADDYGIPLDVPFAELSKRHLKHIHQGIPERNFGGLRGFFRWLERRKYKMHIRVFLSRWRSYRQCPACHGTRLRDIALATRVGDLNIAQVLALEIRRARAFLDQLQLEPAERDVAHGILAQLIRRLQYLESVGVGYLTLERPLRTLSGGEAQRVALTKALGSGLINTLYVLDEPSIGLHERDTRRLVEMVQGLRDGRNSVVVVEHDESFLRAADHVIDLGPGAGASGGRVVHSGPLDGLCDAHDSATGAFLSGRRRIVPPARRRTAGYGQLCVRGARGNNLKSIDVAFPLGVFCAVTGVSGSGKSTLVQQTLYAGLCRHFGRPGPEPAAHETIVGADQISDVVIVDQSPLGRSSRSNPATYVGAFDEIRRLFADCSEARVRNYGPGHFSFNVAGGRCSACEGQGVQWIDMQFLADVTVTCPDCGGLRFRREILEVKQRGKHIAEVLAMSVAEAIGHFRGHPRITERLAPLVAVGLDYLSLGQSTATLSGGEAQRMKLAGSLSGSTPPRTLFLLDEPTTGLHWSDIVRLIECFDALLQAGHSLVVVEHNLDLVKCADWVIDLGPEAAEDGGHVVACGTPVQLAESAASHTGRFLRRMLGESKAAGS